VSVEVHPADCLLILTSKNSSIKNDFGTSQPAGLVSSTKGTVDAVWSATGNSADYVVDDRQRFAEKFFLAKTLKIQISAAT
jgi:hypothetical protein